MSDKCKKYGIYMILVFIGVCLGGCSAFKAPMDENTQPWAQPASWEGQSSLPGFQNESRY